MASYWSDPLVFGPVYGEDPESEGDQDDDSDGPFAGPDCVEQVNAVLDAYLTSLVAVNQTLQRASESVTGLIRAFHAPGGGPAAERALRVNCIDWDELCPSPLVREGHVYVTTEPSMESLELRFNTELLSRVCDPQMMPGEMYRVASMPITGPKFTLITGV